LIIGRDPAQPAPDASDEDIPEPILPTVASPIPGLADAGRSARRRRPAARVLVFWAALIMGVGSIGYLLVSARSGVQPAATADTSGSPRTGPSSPPAPASSRATTAPAVATSQRALSPARASAIGFAGRPGDNSDMARLAIDRNATTAWRTDWYTTARFGNLQTGTGLLLDMGRPVTITTAQVTLGRTPGADIELRAGNVPALADLRTVARATNAGGVVRLRPAGPVRGRYLLIWFTVLPPDPAGTFQASVSSIQLAGRS